MQRMNRDDAKNEIKTRIPCTDYLVKSKRGNYCCPKCKSGEGPNMTGAVKYYANTNTWHCFVCGATGDVIDLYCETQNVDYNAALSSLSEILTIEIDNTAPGATTTQPPAPKKEQKNVKADFREYIERSEKELAENQRARDYLHGRGLTDETIKRFRIGYDVTRKAVVMPYNAEGTYYILRGIDAKEYRKPPSEESGPEPVFQPGALSDPGNLPVFVTEGPFDALSIEQAGGRAVAIGGTGGKKLLDLLPTIPDAKDRPLLIYLDNDEAGRKQGAALAEELIHAGYKPQTVTPEGKYKDANEFLQGDPEGFTRTVKGILSRITRPGSVYDYISAGRFDTDAREFSEGRKTKTGFANLDAEIKGLYNGLYIIGAISSLGKTTFTHQIADQIAEQGKDVLYFSLEQSQLELVSKSLARESAKGNGRKYSSLQIREEQSSTVGEIALRYLAKVGDRLTVIEGNFGTNMKEIREATERHIKRTGSRPAVVVDYLQIIPPADPRQDQRAATDANITALKQMSRDLQIPVLAISSLNRANYTAPVDFESFKESGGIEYSADVIFGLQLDVFKAKPFTDKGDNITEKREAIRKAKAAEIRKIELVCLKNRFGKSGFEIYFDYDPAHDIFTPGTHTEEKTRAPLQRA